MVQQTTDSKCIEYGLGNPEINPSPPLHDRRHPVAAKKTALRELQNENRVLIPKSPYSKEKAPLVDAVKVSGVKRTSQESAVSPSKGQYPSTNAANRHLVYVRRKFEADLGKSSSSSETSINAQHQPQMMEPKVHCFPAFAPMPMTSSISSSAKPTIPPFGKPIMNSAPRECNYHPVASSSPQLDNSRGIRNLPWEERSIRLQALLKHLDELDQEDYVQTFRSFSSVELSRYAVELEKRSIQLSLEEAREVKRVGMLNVLGKSGKHLKSPSSAAPQAQPNK